MRRSTNRNLKFTHANGTCRNNFDGACRNNGHNNTQAGCGVYRGPFHLLNCAEFLRGGKQTSNRGELLPAIMTITRAITCKINWIVVLTDSMYVKDEITKWIKEWKLNDWKTTKRIEMCLIRTFASP